MIAPEFSRRFPLDAIGEGGRDVRIEADRDERMALARRFALESLDRLEATARLSVRAGVVRAEGRVIAEAVQACVASGAPVPAVIDEPFHLRFVADGPAGEDVELSDADLDTLPLDGGAVDLGEAAAETLALALPAFPRAPDADAILRAAGVKSEEEAGPFGALAGLKDRLGGKA